jgi:predicted permease
MLATLLQMFALIGLGLGWSFFNPAKLDDETTRRVVTSVVYYLFLPALVLNVLWTAPLGVDTAKISASATAGVVMGLLLSWAICRTCRSDRSVTGAIMLAAGFPNATYMGLPLLENTLGPWARSIAIQYDLFACTPLLLTVGIILASAFGGRERDVNPVLALARVPPLWAAAAAVALNVRGVPAPVWLEGFLRMMGAAVVPLMLIAVGMALRQGFGQWRHLPTVIPVLVIQLLLMPLLVWGVASGLGLKGDILLGVVLEGAMPTMALGVVLSDRYGLNTGVYASAMTITTLFSAFTLPLWFQWVH